MVNDESTLQTTRQRFRCNLVVLTHNCTARHRSLVFAYYTSVHQQVDFAKLKIDMTQDISSEYQSDTLGTVTAATTVATTDSESLPYFINAFSTDSIETARAAHESVLFRTPCNKAVRSFENLGISSGSVKLTLEETKVRIEQDGILDEAFVYHKDEFRCCIVFLYAMEFFWKKTREERVAKIKQCLDRESGSFRRLRLIALSDSTDKTLFDENSFQLYFNMASTARIFFAQSGEAVLHADELVERNALGTCFRRVFTSM